MDFDPQHFQQMAGLVCYYNSAKFHYLFVTHNDEQGRVLQVMSALANATVSETFTAPIAIPEGPIELRVDVDHSLLRFSYRLDGQDWTMLPQHFDASILSDEANPLGAVNFTGAFVGMACQDMAGTARPADFDWFEYDESSNAR